MREVEFKGTYRERSGLAGSLGDALAGRLDPEWALPGSLPAGGRVVKTTGGMLEEFVPDAPPERRNGQWHGRQPQVDVTVGGVAGTVNAEVAGAGGTLAAGATFYRRLGSDVPGEPAAGQSGGGLGPLTLLGSTTPAGSASRSPIGMDAAGFSCEVLDAVDGPGGAVVVRTRIKHGMNAVEDRKIIFAQHFGTLVLTRVDVSTTFNGGSQSAVVEASDFVEVPGGPVARTVRRAVETSKKGTYDVLEWRSEDLGEEPPTAADLVLDVPAGVPAFGLAGEPVVSTEERRVDLSSLTVADLTAVEPNQVRRTRQNLVAQRPWVPAWGWAGLIALAAAGLWWALRRRGVA